MPSGMMPQAACRPKLKKIAFLDASGSSQTSVSYRMCPLRSSFPSFPLPGHSCGSACAQERFPEGYSGHLAACLRIPGLPEPPVRRHDLASRCG